MEIREEDKGMKMIVILREFELPVIEEYNDGVFIGRGTYTHEDYAAAVLQSIDFQTSETPLLPRNTILFCDGPVYKRIFMEIPAHRRTVYYHEAVIEDIPYPTLIFGISVKLVQEKYVVHGVYIAAVEETFNLSEATELFHYPFTNVSDSNSKVCWGTQKLPEFDAISQLSSIPELFFNTPNSDSYYGSPYNTNLTFRELIEEIKGKSFPDKYLKPKRMNLKQWIDTVTNSLY